MITLDSIKSILSLNKKDLQQKYQLKNICLFGSFTRKEEKPDSDIDILVEFQRPVGFEFIDLADELERLLNHKVDLVSKAAVKPRLMKYIEQDLIYV